MTPFLGKKKSFNRTFYFCDKKTGRTENISFSRYISLAKQQLGEKILDKCFPSFFDLTSGKESRFCVFCETGFIQRERNLSDETAEKTEELLKGILKK